MDEALPITAPRIARREAWVELPEAYAGFKFKLWVNAPQRLWQDVASGDETRARAALAQIIMEHNGWLDYDGQPFPPASDPALWEAAPTELAALIITAANAEMMRLPNSLAPRKRR
jgi:hypothetical protein